MQYAVATDGGSYAVKATLTIRLTTTRNEKTQREAFEDANKIRGDETSLLNGRRRNRRTTTKKKDTGDKEDEDKKGNTTPDIRENERRKEGGERWKEEQSTQTARLPLLL